MSRTKILPSLIALSVLAECRAQQLGYAPSTRAACMRCLR